MATHYKALSNPDYIGAWAFQPGETKTVTIDTVGVETVTGAEGKTEACTVVHFRERGVKPLILNSTNGKAIAKLLASPFVEDWQGHRINLRVQNVKAFGDVVPAVRVSPILPAQNPEPSPVCADCGKLVQGVGSRNAAAIAAYTGEKYGRVLCGDCAAKIAAKQNPPEEMKQEEGAENA